jgi:CDP-4-dehydro-6-deoxyglucose reductase
MLTYGDRVVNIAPGETVLEALLRVGIDAQHSCRSGQCQTCLHRAIEGTPPAVSQIGLTDAQKALGFFLPCVCELTTPITVVRADEVGARVDAIVRSVEPLSENIIRLRLEADIFSYRPGQFLELIAKDDLKRHYSLASHPEEDPYLEMHIRLYQNGRMSQHLMETLSPGHKIHVAGPLGTCFYEGVASDQPLVLVGVGTGLAPLYGVLRDALRSGHRGPIRLYHGARDSKSLYLRGELETLANARKNFAYTPCALNTDAPHGGDVGAVAVESETGLADSAFFLCGDENLVARLKRELFMRGASLKAIRSDAFTPGG